MKGMWGCWGVGWGLKFSPKRLAIARGGKETVPRLTVNRKMMYWEVKVHFIRP